MNYSKYIKYTKKNNNIQKGGIVTDTSIENLTMDEIYDNVYIVHVFDEDGLKNSNFEPDKWYYNDSYNDSIGSNKMIHTSWGVKVLPHRKGQWDVHYKDQFAIITPFRLQKGRVYKINPNDTMIFKYLGISEDSFFIYPASSKTKISDLLSRIQMKKIEYNNEKKEDNDMNACINNKLSELNNDEDKTIFKKFIESVRNKIIFSPEFCDKPLFHPHANIYKWNASTTAKDCLEASGTFDYTLKQVNELLPLAVSCIYKETLRNKIEEIIKQKTGSFINSHCESKTSPSVKTYNHPTPCFDHKGKNYNLYDDVVVDDNLKYDEGVKRELYGRHYGIGSYLGVDIIDNIQDFFNDKETYYQHFSNGLDKFEQQKKLENLKEKFKNFVERNENQFPISNEDFMGNIISQFIELTQFLDNKIKNE